MPVESPVVFDAEPLLAYLGDEPGSQTVEDVLEALREDRIEGYVNYVTLCEVTYVAERVLDSSTVRGYVETLQEYGLQPIGVDDVWRQAAAFKNEHDVSLGDAVMLATASQKRATAFVGADADFETVSDVSLERFRTEPA